MSLFKNPILEVASTYGATVKNFTLGFSPKIFLGVTIHVGGSGKNFWAKSPWKIFQGRPRKKIIPKSGKKYHSPGYSFLRNWKNIWEVWQLVCEGLWTIAKNPKFGFCFPKQRLPEIFQMQLFSTESVVHLRVVTLSRNFCSEPKIEIYGHLIFYLLSFWPTVTVLVVSCPTRWYLVGGGDPI